MTKELNDELLVHGIRGNMQREINGNGGMIRLVVVIALSMAVLIAFGVGIGWAIWGRG